MTIAEQVIETSESTRPTLKDANSTYAESLSSESTLQSAYYDNMSFRPSQVFRWYHPILQRQQWGDSQVLPRVNWGDLFFDLFYVGATYNVSATLVGSPNKIGILYTAGTFLPVVGCWLEKLYFDARFCLEVNLFHRIYQLVHLVVLATAVLHIRSVEDLSHPSKSFAMVGFCASLVAERVLALLRCFETEVWGVGQKQVLKHQSRTHLLRTTISIVPFIVALIIAAKDHVLYRGKEDTIGAYGGHRYMGETTSETTSEAVHASTNETMRETSSASSSYAESSSYSEPEANHIPIFLIFFGYIFWQFVLNVQIIYFFPKGGKHKEV
jgi:hypothetical protein